MKALRTLALAGFAFTVCMAMSPASIQPRMYCWAYDQEFPVPCADSEEGEDEATAAPPARP